MQRRAAWKARRRRQQCRKQLVRGQVRIRSRLGRSSEQRRSGASCILSARHTARVSRCATPRSLCHVTRTVASAVRRRMLRRERQAQGQELMLALMLRLGD